MTKQKHRISLANIGVRTDAEIVQSQIKYELREQLGLIFDFDGVYSKKEYARLELEFLRISSQYKNLDAYELDRHTVSSLITENKPIPQELYNKLLITKQELDKAGLKV